MMKVLKKTMAKWYLSLHASFLQTKLSIESKNKGNSSASQNLIHSKIPVLLICAATATGKTDFLLSSFNKTEHEIISADSLQVYKELSIGTAKPTLAERSCLPHHLIDIIEPKEEFGSGDFVRLADQAVLDIWNRGKKPIIAGGTGFFIKNFLYGLPPTPAVDEAIRSDLQKRLKNEGAEALYKELFLLDAERAKKLHPNDSYRVLRALEVYYTSGKKLSTFALAPQLRNRYAFLVLYLTRERDSIYERINERVDRMFEKGLWEELVALTTERKNPLVDSDPSMSAIGYKEFFLHSNNSGKSIADFNAEDCLAVKSQIQRNTRQYAKRQIVFFKALSPAISLHIDDNLAIKTIINDFYASFT